MPLHFPNLTRPKRASKLISKRLPIVQLAQAQRAVAISLGYSDWFELERGHRVDTPSPLDERLPLEEARQRWTKIVLSLSNELNVPNGDVQSFLDILRLTGNRRLTFDDHEAVRTACWRLGPIPRSRKHNPGMTCMATYERSRKSRERAYLKRIGQGEGAEVVSDNADIFLLADYEVVCPRTPVADFVPLRLWLPYGSWTLRDGREVLFSRDYCPLWSISPDGTVERARPWEWIEGIEKQHHFSKVSDQIWHDDATVAIAKEPLYRHGIFALPMLADALPILVNYPQMRLKKATELLRPS